MFGSNFSTNVKTTGYELTGDLGKCLRMGGLTFYKDFTKSGSLDADFALGSRKATYTSTSGTPTLGANGYAATTANDDVLTYEIAKNRTAAQETIVIKFMPSSDFANDGVARFLIDNGSGTETRRVFVKDSSLTVLSFKPDNNDTATRKVVGTTTLLADTSYVIAGSCQTVGTPNGTLYINSVSEGTPSTDDFTFTDFGTSFFIGSRYSGTFQLEGSIAWIKIFNRVLTVTEIGALL